MRYIDADALIKKIYPMGIGDGKYTINAKAVKLAIDNAPTADVVPKSEVEALIKENERWMMEYADYRAEVNSTIEKAKSEVAREVAYDFQNRLRHIFLDMCNYNDYETLNLLQIDSAIEALYDTFFPELKKKYTEDKT